MDIEEDIKKISKRFQNGTETIEDILDYCKNYEITFENGTKMKLVDKKYLDKLVKEYKKLLAEREEDKKKIANLKEIDEANRKVIAEQCDYLQNRSIPKQKVKEELEKAEKENEPYEQHNKESRMFWINQGKIRLAKKLLEDK